MKDKLIVKLKQFILDMKESSDTLTVEVSDENKDTIFSDLIVPFMQLTESESVSALADTLDQIVDGDVEADDHTELLGKIVDVMIEESDADKIEEELENLVTNAYAVRNKFNELKAKTITVDNKEAGTEFDAFSKEIVDFMNTDLADDNKDESADDTDVTVNIDNKDEAAGDGEEDDAGEADAGEEDAGGEGEAGMVITASTDEVDETPWVDINKIEMKNALETALTDEVEGVKEAIDEVYALVRSYEKKSDWQQPHHIVKDNNVVLNTNGLKTAALFLLKPASSKNLTPEDRSKVAKHLLKHYQEIDMAAPAKLSNMSEGKESTIMINIKEDEMKEFGQMFDVDVEDVAVYVGLMESLLTDLVNSGILNIDSDDKDMDESVVSVKLDKGQTEELIKYFDIMTNDITHVLNSEFDQMSYKKTDADLNNSYSEAQETIVKLSEQVEELETTISERNDEVANLSTSHDSVTLDKTKFEAIINFVKSIENVDETLVQFIHNVIDADDSVQIGYLTKLGGTFMRQTSSPARFTKVSMLNHATRNDINTLTNLVERGDKKESSTLATEVNKTVDELASLFD